MDKRAFLDGLMEHCNYILDINANYQSQIVDGEFQLQIDNGGSITSSTLRVAEDNDNNIHIFVYTSIITNNGLEEHVENYWFKFDSMGHLIDRNF